jgi:hypothetical protein
MLLNYLSRLPVLLLAPTGEPDHVVSVPVSNLIRWRQRLKPIPCERREGAESLLELRGGGLRAMPALLGDVPQPKIPAALLGFARARLRWRFSGFDQRAINALDPR